MLEVKNFSIKSKEDGRMLLEKVNFKVDKNEIHCILGKNGSGKTTVAYSIMGLEKYQQVGGKIIFEGKDITKLKPHERARKGITIAFQEPARFEGLTVGDFLRAGKKDATISQLKKYLEIVGLKAEDFIDRKLDNKLSGGERKRIELASVMMMKPKLMILDEPDASLDIIVYNELYDLMLRIKEELGCAILLITHREEAGLIASGATLISEGKVIATGPFRKVMRKYCAREGQQDRCLAFKNKMISAMTGEGLKS
ncbi:ATP-binding cassette domain-containing protein [bacterium]|jgi:Fe-S cluster assembly ATP-binding protein|nr:ATP-binding cassette domain-containing protein [bacterium]MBT4251283.1 ATP-binding cassette domain-containing protein [bacterium]MBT4598336.1 ATP-binding cassette domain-containing protein [bacterium]MBT6754169.1 ATP-binding cassette domain-containing protein [bacterium]MBT7037227.1 ATP-binding cassette domain-containing protein [bacterium]